MGVQASRTLPQIEHRQLPSLSRSLLALSRLPLLGRPLSRPSRSLPWHRPLPWQMASILRRKQARGAVSSGSLTRRWKQQMQQQLPLRQQHDKAQAAEELDALKLADAEAAGSVRSADVKDVSSAAHLRASEVPELAEDVDVEAGEGQGAQLSTASEAAGTSCQAGAIREAAVVTSSEESAPARHRPAAASADELPESPESADMEAGTA